MASSERKRLRVAASVALGLHAGLMSLAFLSRTPGSVTPRDPGARGLLWLEEYPVEAAAPPAGPSPFALLEDSRPARSRDRQRTLAPARGRDEPATTTLPEPEAGASSDGAEAGTVGDAAADGKAGGEDGALALGALGVGENPFLPALARDAATAKPRRSSQGFRRSLSTGILAQDQAVGLGPEGPILTKLERAVRQSSTPPNSNALFRFRIDRAGKLTSVEVVEGSGDERFWRTVARKLRQELEAVKLRLPKLGRGATLDLRVDSRIQLPSGADPGLALDLFGIPLKEGDGDRSTRISLFTIAPGGRERSPELPGGEFLRLPEAPMLVIFALAGDPVDIGAKPQRVVRAHVERLTADQDEAVLPAHESEAAPRDAGPRAVTRAPAVPPE